MFIGVFFSSFRRVLKIFGAILAFFGFSACFQFFFLHFLLLFIFCTFFAFFQPLFHFFPNISHFPIQQTPNIWWIVEINFFFCRVHDEVCGNRLETTSTVRSLAPSAVRSFNCSLVRSFDRLGYRLHNRCTFLAYLSNKKARIRCNQSHVKWTHRTDPLELFGLKYLNAERYCSIVIVEKWLKTCPSKHRSECIRNNKRPIMESLFFCFMRTYSTLCMETLCSAFKKKTIKSKHCVNQTKHNRNAIAIEWGNEIDFGLIAKTKRDVLSTAPHRIGAPIMHSIGNHRFAWGNRSLARARYLLFFYFRSLSAWLNNHRQ